MRSDEKGDKWVVWYEKEGDEGFIPDLTLAIASDIPAADEEEAARKANIGQGFIGPRHFVCVQRKHVKGVTLRGRHETVYDRVQED